MVKNQQTKNFLWGVTHIGTQVEGDCTTNDWYYAACSGRVPAIGRSNQYWENYSTHHDFVEDLGCGAMRISLEWARIEPMEGIFDAQAVSQYRKILENLTDRNITTVVGLFHWSVPIWFAQKYGMHSSHAHDIFIRYVEHVRNTLGDMIDIVVVLNEPVVFVGTGYLLRERPPFRCNPFLALRAFSHLAQIHNSTYALWKGQFPESQVGSAHLWNDIRAKKRHLLGRVCEKVSEYARVGAMIARTKKRSDYIGINYYTSNQFYFGKKNGRYFIHGTNDWHAPDVWYHFAAGFAYVLSQAARYGLPLYILENGKPSNLGTEDEDRQIFLKDHISVLGDALACGTDIRGYFHYALMDAYEWNSGYDFRFGLVEVDRDTLEMRRRKSFTHYKNIIETDVF